MWDFELLEEHKDISEVYRLVNEYSLYVGYQSVGIKIFLDSSGYYQMKTSHHYQGKNQAGVYTVSRANFSSEEEALGEAKRQLIAFYDGEGTWSVNENY